MSSVLGQNPFMTPMLMNCHRRLEREENERIAVRQRAERERELARLAASKSRAGEGGVNYKGILFIIAGHFTLSRR